MKAPNRVHRVQPRPNRVPEIGQSHRVHRVPTPTKGTRLTGTRFTPQTTHHRVPTENGHR